MSVTLYARELSCGTEVEWDGRREMVVSAIQRPGDSRVSVRLETGKRLSFHESELVTTHL
jgi:hypothetical protein